MPLLCRSTSFCQNWMAALEGHCFGSNVKAEYASGNVVFVSWFMHQKVVSVAMSLL